MCQALLEFEREVGSLESYEGAMERCAAQLRRVKERREKVREGGWCVRVCGLSNNTIFCSLLSPLPLITTFAFLFLPLPLTFSSCSLSGSVLPLSLSLSSPKAAEKEAQLKEEKKQRKRSEKAERKTAGKQDHGGKQQQDAEGRREGGRGWSERGGKRGSGGRGEEGRGEGGEWKGRKRAKAAHVYFDDSEEEKETPAKKQRGRLGARVLPDMLCVCPTL